MSRGLILEHREALDVVLEALSDLLVVTAEQVGIAAGLGAEFAQLGHLVGGVDRGCLLAEGRDLAA